MLIGRFFPFSSGVSFIWIYDIDLVMRNFCSDLSADFIRSNIHFLENLPTITRNNFNRKKLGKLYRESTFPGRCCSPNNNNSLRILIPKILNGSFCILEDISKIHNFVTKLKSPKGSKKRAKNKSESFEENQLLRDGFDFY